MRQRKKELEPFLLNHKIHLISLSRLDEKEVEKYKSDFWHVIKFLTLHGYGKTRKYLEEESGKRKLKHPEEVQNVLYALSSDKRFLEADLAKKGKEEPKMGQISDVLDQIEAIMFDKGVEQGIERGVEQERKHLQRKSIACRTDQRRSYSRTFSGNAGSGTSGEVDERVRNRVTGNKQLV